MRAVFTDLDGSLHHGELGVHPLDRDSLEQLGQLGVARVVATGRSLYSSRKVLSPDFPIDYLIFSSGAGILDWRSQQLLSSHGLTATDIARGVSCLQELQLDFMLHHQVPDNHVFWYRRQSQNALQQRGHADFERRLALYENYALPLDSQTPLPQGPCAQFLAVVEAAQTEFMHQYLQQELPDLSIIRATSPLDGCSGWLEIFPAHVSKSQASAWLCAREQWQTNMAFGNDYNDTDLLAWSDRAFVADNAPAVLTERYQTVPCPSRAGFSQAVNLWLKE